MSMLVSITDGLTSNTARVTKNGRAEVEGVNRTHGSAASIDGDSYNVNSGTINLTTSNKSAVLYIKNGESRDLIIDTLFYLLGNSTGGSGDVLITVLRNPTAFSTSTAADMAGVNRNFGSAKTLSNSLLYKGAEAATATGGDKVIESIFNQSATRAALSVGTIVLSQGTALAIEITPATGNTSLDVQVAAAVYLREELQ